MGKAFWLPEVIFTFTPNPKAIYFRYRTYLCTCIYRARKITQQLYVHCQALKAHAFVNGILESNSRSVYTEVTKPMSSFYKLYTLHWSRISVYCTVFSNAHLKDAAAITSLLRMYYDSKESKVKNVQLDIQHKHGNYIPNLDKHVILLFHVSAHFSIRDVI